MTGRVACVNDQRCAMLTTLAIAMPTAPTVHDGRGFVVKGGAMATELTRLSVDIVHMRRLIADDQRRRDVGAEFEHEGELRRLLGQVNAILDKQNAAKVPA